MEETAVASSRALDELCINTVRTLSMDAVGRAKSGHPGAPMGLAPLCYVLWTKHLRHNPSDPTWFGRDRFVLSCGHASMLLYSLLYLTGYDITLGDLKDFRQWESRTPGHPEHGLTPGVETTTGPLGQGLGNAVGMALAAARLADEFNRPGIDLIDHHVYFIASDGDIMEGLSHEVASIAGHLRLGNVIGFYDDNRITIDGETSLTLSDDTAARFEAYGWFVQRVEDGNDLQALDRAIDEAKSVHDRPSLIILQTHIGYGSPTKQDTAAAITDPGSQLASLANERGFRRVFLNPPEVGGRYSALSLFVLVPASLIGVDVRLLLDRARTMADACAAELLSRNPGATLGAFLAEHHDRGKDKLYLSCSRGVSSLGLWVEQLVAERTGKAGIGILPVLDSAPVRTSDGMYVEVSLSGDRASQSDANAGGAHPAAPALEITLDDAYDLGAEFFRWCFGIAIAGALLRVNPFDQPNVSESKANTQRVLSTGRASPVATASRPQLDEFLSSIRRGHYLAILAYTAPDASRDERFRALCTTLAARMNVATTFGYGPRYLHSTGQLHKGGPPVGHFIQLVDLPRDRDIEIPGESYTFGDLIAAQADGDYEALAARGRPILRIEHESILD